MIVKERNKKAFTLIELIVVIAIIGVLVAILVPTMTGFVNDARVATANANARTVYSIAQAEATFQTNTGSGVADGTYTQASADTFSTTVRSQMGTLAAGATYSITIAGGAVTTVSFTGSDGVTGTYPKV